MSDLHPTDHGRAALAANPDPGPVVMLNLLKFKREVSFTSHFYKPQRLLWGNVRWRLPKESPQGGGAAYGKQIIVTVSRDLTVNHGRYFKRKLGALREGAPA